MKSRLLASSHRCLRSACLAPSLQDRVAVSAFEKTTCAWGATSLLGRRTFFSLASHCRRQARGGVLGLSLLAGVGLQQQKQQRCFPGAIRLFSQRSERNSYYKLLEVSPKAPATAIKTAYRRLALQYHPDHNQDSTEEATAKFRDITAAYTCLSNPRSRLQYDLQNRMHVRSSSQAGVSSSFAANSEQYVNKKEVAWFSRSDAFSQFVLAILVLQGVYWLIQWFFLGFAASTKLGLKNPNEKKMAGVKGMMERWKDRELRHQQIQKDQRAFTHAQEPGRVASSLGSFGTAGSTAAAQALPPSVSSSPHSAGVGFNLGKS